MPIIRSRHKLELNMGEGFDQLLNGNSVRHKRNLLRGKVSADLLNAMLRGSLPSESANSLQGKNEHYNQSFILNFNVEDRNSSLQARETLVSWGAYIKQERILRFSQNKSPHMAGIRRGSYSLEENWAKRSNRV